MDTVPTINDRLAPGDIHLLLERHCGIKAVELLRLKSEDHMVYRFGVEGRDDLVIKIAGEGKQREKKIVREIKTIQKLKDIVSVPNILKYGKKPRPFFIMPCYKNDQNVTYGHFLMNWMDHIEKLSGHKSTRACPPALYKVLSLIHHWFRLYSLERDSQLREFFPGIEQVRNRLREIIMSDEVLTGQPRPGEMIFAAKNPRVVDWSEGFRKCLFHQQLAFITFYKVIKDPVNRIKETEMLLKTRAVNQHIPDLGMLKTWWKIIAITDGLFLFRKYQSAKFLETFSGYYRSFD